MIGNVETLLNPKVQVKLSLFHIIGIFLEDGQVCCYSNFQKEGRSFESGDIVNLPRHGKETAVALLGIHENLAEASSAATHYFKRLCKWDNVEDISGIKLFGFDLAPIEEEVSQIGLFGTQGFEGPMLLSTNSFDLMCLKQTENSQED